MEFSKFLQSIRNQNLMMEKSLKLESIEEIHFLKMIYSSKTTKLRKIIGKGLNRYNFDKLKDKKKKII